MISQFETHEAVRSDIENCLKKALTMKAHVPAGTTVEVGTQTTMTRKMFFFIHGLIPGIKTVKIPDTFNGSLLTITESLELYSVTMPLVIMTPPKTI